MSLSQKLIGGFLLVTVIMGAFGFFMFQRVSSQLSTTQHKVNESSALSSAIQDFHIENYHTQLEVWEYAHLPNEKRLNAFYAHLVEFDVLFNEFITLADRAELSAEDQAVVADLKSGVVDIRQTWIDFVAATAAVSTGTLATATLDDDGMAKYPLLDGMQDYGYNYSYPMFDPASVDAFEPVLIAQLSAEGGLENVYDDADFNSDADAFVASQHSALAAKVAEADTLKNSLTAQFVVAFVIVLGLSIVLALALTNMIARPIKKLSIAANRIGGGDLDVPLPHPGKDEIGLLTTAFQLMRERLRANISKLESTLEAEREAARHDALTGALNHGAITQVLRDICASTPEESSAVAMIDVDGLKTTNDTYGHQIGDQVLIATAEALSRDGVIVGRYGGDEFIAVLPGADRVEAEQFRDAVNAVLDDVHLVDPDSSERVPVNTSIGLAVYPEEAETVADLIRLSDSAMYAWRRRHIVSGEVAMTGRLEDERAALMVGQIVPLLTAPGELNERLGRAAHRLSVGAGYDAAQFTLFAASPGTPTAHNAHANVDDELLEAWRHEQRRDGTEPNPLRILLEREHRPIVLDDISSDNRLVDSQRQLLVAAGIKCGVVVPLIWRDQVIGSLSVGSKRLAAFGAAEAQFLTSVATQATAVIRTEALVEDLQSASTLLELAHAETVMLLAAVAEAHDKTTGLHLQSVRSLSEALARELGYSDADADAVGLASALHDIGKVRVADAILTNPGKLARDQWEIMRQHTIWGASFLADRPGFELAASIALHHHEDWDGGGYPNGLSGHEIPEAARIVAVADAFDAITHDRPYRDARPVDRPVHEIVICAGTQFDPTVAAALERLCRRDELPVMHPDASIADAA